MDKTSGCGARRALNARERSGDATSGDERRRAATRRGKSEAGRARQERSPSARLLLGKRHNSTKDHARERQESCCRLTDLPVSAKLDGKKDPSAAPAPDIATRSVPRSSSGPDPMVSVRQWPLVASANAAAPRRPPLPLVTVGIELETDSPDTKYFMLTASGDVERARDVERSYFWSSI